MTLGVALAGGGLKGLAHIGALNALEELGIKIDYLSGTSSGSLFAAMYAMGFSKEEIKKYTMEHYKSLTKIDKLPILKAGTTYLASGVARIAGLSDGDHIANIIRTVASKDNKSLKMNDVNIPLALCTVDTVSTKECIFLSQKFDLENNENIDYLYDVDISTAVRASMSFPGIYTPCNYGKYNFIDGGTKDNLPVHILKDMGAEKTIALSFRIDDYEPKDDILAILLRTVDIFSLKDVRKAQKEADLSIEIDARGASLLEIDDPDKLIKTGYDTVMKYKDQILQIVNKN